MNKLKILLSSQPRDQIVFDLTSYQEAIESSVKFLDSDRAFASIEQNPYWPKWDSPWWHMSVLFEMGMGDRIPRKTAQHMLAAAKRTQLPYFFRGDAPSDKRADQEAPCPCSLGNIYQILGSTGVDVDNALPWAREWFLKYQMPDGGLNCDEDAYHGEHNASSLVGTISPLEAIMSTGKLTVQEEAFLDRGAKCLIDRELRMGSSSKHNAEERLDEDDWLKPCFPRLYFYDVLRGLSFILRWSDRLNRQLPLSAVVKVVTHFSIRFPDGKIQTQRFSYEGVGTKLLNSSGVWERGHAATFFPLLAQLSELNFDSPFLTAQWLDAVRTMDRLSARGLIT